MKGIAITVSALLLTACAIPAKTTITKDGFTARQKTTEAHRAVVEGYETYHTVCRYDQLQGDKDSSGHIKHDEEGNALYYCPADGSKEGYNSSVILLSNYMESVLDKWGPSVLSAGAMVGSAGIISHGLRHQAVPQGAQFSVNEQFSTKFIGR